MTSENKKVNNEVTLNADEIKAVERKVGRVLLSLGVSPALNGYQYIQKIVGIAWGKPELIRRSLVKGAYAEAAKALGVEPSNIERSIRHVCQYINNNCAGMPTAIEVLGPCLAQTQPVTNASLIAGVYEYVVNAD